MTRLLVLLSAVLLAGTASAQTPAPPPAAAPPQAAADAHLPTPPADFTYSAGGRRDPFAALTRPNGGSISVPTGMRPAGAAGLLVDELTVKGILLTNGTFVAMVSGPGPSQTYSVRAGSKLFDGTVRAIDARSVVILQQVTDPLSVQKQREVRKLLRTQEEGK
ncbi:MAG: hypothetical protein R2708_26455 [Vicinamibacterales bacterium]